jgi:hypothetical protein
MRVMASGVCGTLSRTALAVAVAGVAVMGATVPASTTPALAGQDDPGCEMFGWRHPLCAGGAFESPPDEAYRETTPPKVEYRPRRWCRTPTARSAPRHAWGDIAQATQR